MALRAATPSEAVATEYPALFRIPLSIWRVVASSSVTRIFDMHTLLGIALDSVPLAEVLSRPFAQDIMLAASTWGRHVTYHGSSAPRILSNLLPIPQSLPSIDHKHGQLRGILGRDPSPPTAGQSAGLLRRQKCPGSPSGHAQATPDFRCPSVAGPFVFLPCAEVYRALRLRSCCGPAFHRRPRGQAGWPQPSPPAQRPNASSLQVAPLGGTPESRLP